MFSVAKNWVRLDRLAISLSTLCAVHCVATLILLGALSSLGHVFTAPIIHEAGLALAIVIGALALGGGLKRHRLFLPSVVGAAGLMIMGMALLVPHGIGEAVATIIGVSLVAIAHFFNMRADAHIAERLG